MPFYYRKKDPKADTYPKIVENAKTSMVIRGKNTSETIKQVLSDLNALRKPNSIKLNKKNDILPFEKSESIEFLSQKNDCSLFLMGTHTKKRPHNLTMGRLFDYKMLDMVEFGVQDFKPLTKDTNTCSHLGSKPCIVFQGSAFVNDDTLKIVQNMFLGMCTMCRDFSFVFLDFFRGVQPNRINILGLDHVVILTALSAKQLHFGHYAIKLSKSGTDVPRVELEDIGPSMVLNLGRTKLAAPDLRKIANFIPQELRKSKTKNKNVSKTPLGDVQGRIHMDQQPIQSISLRRFTGTRKDEDIDEQIRRVAAGEDVLQKPSKAELDAMDIDEDN